MGFRKVRQVGFHVQLAKGERRVTIPKHSSIAPGTLRSILRQAGIELEVFLNEL
ncbi:MAG: type II toxin-antitoxin system HicA family toxin [Bryobacteraceae bacterium]